MTLRFRNPDDLSKGETRGSLSPVQPASIESSGKDTDGSPSLGQDLRNARRRKGLELAHVSNRLKISKRYLTALEENKLELLPQGMAYRIGFARSYAVYLGLNATQCLEKLQAEISEREGAHGISSTREQLQRPKPINAVRAALSYFGRRD